LGDLGVTERIILKIDTKETEYRDMDYIHVVQDSIQWKPLEKR
jgi:hypothetical protein